MRYRQYLHVALFSLLAACGGGPGGGAQAPQPVVPVSPGLTVEPPPGEYTHFPLYVSVSTAPGYELYWALNKNPLVDPNLAYHEKFSVRLVGSSELSVLIRSQEGELFGPYSYRYLLKTLRHDGACEIATLPRHYFRADEHIPITVQYALPNALARLEIAFNGIWEVAKIDDVAGVYEFEGNPRKEGHRYIGCRVVQGEQEWPGNEIDFTIDATPPSGYWLNGNFSFDQQTWRNALTIDAYDALSGLAEALLCNADTGNCVPMAFAGGGLYEFSTQFTEATSFSVPIYVRLRDIAGNETFLPEQTLDFSGYPDPLPAFDVQAIELTTAPTLDLLAVTGTALDEVRRIDGSPLDSGEAAYALQLAPGWNEFAYRRVGTRHWETYAIYRTGLEVSFPATSAPQWLVFAGDSTYPALASERLAIVPGSSDGPEPWRKDWFEIPRLFFIEDDGDGRWTENDRLFVNASHAWPTPPELGQSANIAPVLYLPPIAPPVAMRAVTVEVAPGLPDVPVIFEWRDSLTALPAIHTELTVPEYPAQVSVPEWGTCIFFLDVAGTGALSSTAPRAVRSCTEDSFTIANATASLAISPLFEVTGMRYGSAVTGWVDVLDDDGNELVSYPIPMWQDKNGLGWMVAGRDFPFIRYLRLPFRLRLYNEGQIAERHGEAVETAPHSSPTVSVSVLDQSGAPVQALVVSGSEEHGYYEPTDTLGNALVPIPLAEPAVLYALRDGWLSMKAVANEPSQLRVLHPSVTGMLKGTVKDKGAPVVNAEVVWESERFVARGRTDAHGAYALPASGGTGLLTVHVRKGNDFRAVSYPFSVTREVVSADVTAPAEPPPVALPAGLHGGAPPDELQGAGYLWVGESHYQAITEASQQGPWRLTWSNGFSRQVTLPGALPQFLTGDWEGRFLPMPEVGIEQIALFARCGAWEQMTLAGLSVQMPCWTWLAADGNQTYIAGLPDDDGNYPDAMGLGYFYGVLLASNGTMAQGEQRLVLHDRVLGGRTIFVDVVDGAIDRVVPYGQYEVKTPAGASVMSGGGPAVVTVLPGNSNGYTLTLP